jgi:hypothetical protein
MRQTLPTLTRGWPWGLDVVRKTIRSSPALQQLGQRIGANKLYTTEEVEQIRTAVEQREAAKRGAVPAAGV